MKPLHTQTAALLQTADELETTVRQVGGWTFQAVDEVLDAIDILIAALCRVGPDVPDALSPIQRDLVALQTRIAAVAKESARPRPGRRIPRSATAPHPGDSPEDWIGRDDWVAEQLYLRLRLPGAADDWAGSSTPCRRPRSRRRRAGWRPERTGRKCWTRSLPTARTTAPPMTGGQGVGRAAATRTAAR